MQNSLGRQVLMVRLFPEPYQQEHCCIWLNTQSKERIFAVGPVHSQERQREKSSEADGFIVTLLHSENLGMHEF